MGEICRACGGPVAIVQHVQAAAFATVGTWQLQIRQDDCIAGQWWDLIDAVAMPENCTRRLPGDAGQARGPAPTGTIYKDPGKLLGLC